MIKTECRNCGKNIEVIPSEKKEYNYCSRDCFNKARRKGLVKCKKKKGKYVECENCGKKIYRKPYRLKNNKSHHCSYECLYESQKDNFTKKCKNCGKEYKTHRSQVKHRGSSYCSKKCMTEHRIGKNSPLWKENKKTNINKQVRECSKYKEWRSKIFKNDEYTCQICGQIGGYLEVHHLEPLQKIIDISGIKNSEQARKVNLMWNENLGITLCVDCHCDIDKSRNQLKPG